MTAINTRPENNKKSHNVAVPVEVLQHGYELLEDEWHSIGEDCYNVEVDSFERYCKVVKVLAEKIFRRRKRG